AARRVRAAARGRVGRPREQRRFVGVGEFVGRSGKPAFWYGGAAVCAVAVIGAGCQSPAPANRPEARASSSPSAAAPAPGPRFAASGPDALDYGASQGYPIGDRTTYFRVPFLVGSHSHLDEIFEGGGIRRADAPSVLARADPEPEIRYEADGEVRTLDDYLERNPATGLLVARDETILVERYQYGRNDRH